MNDSRFKKAIDEIKKIAMTAGEKRAVFERSMDMARSVAPVSRPIRSPWTLYSFGMWVRQNRLTSAVSATLAIVLIGGGIVSGSGGALPGDALYPIKVSVAEPIRAAFISMPEAKARFEVKLATERLKEAEILVAQGRLDDSKQQRIDDLLTEHTVAFFTVMEQAERESSGSTEVTDDIKLDFKANMNAHAKLLETMDTESRSGSSSPARIAAKARETADMVVPVTVAFEDKTGAMLSARLAEAPAKQFELTTTTGSISVTASMSVTVSPSPLPSPLPSPSPFIRDAASSTPVSPRKRAVESRIYDIRENINRATIASTSSDFKRSVITETRLKLEEAEQSLDRADRAHREGNDGDEDVSLSDSEQSVREASIFLKAGLELNKKVNKKAKVKSKPERDEDKDDK